MNEDWHLNYFNYFTEIEERFQQRRGALLLLSTLDWALIESWREAGIPLEAVLRGIDTAFDKYEARKQRAAQSQRLAADMLRGMLDSIKRWAHEPAPLPAQPPAAEVRKEPPSGQ